MKTISKLFLALIALLPMLQACDSSDSEVAPSNQQGTSGQAGSMARFAIRNGHLYIVNQQELRTYSLQDSTNPTLVNRMEIAWNLETIFPQGNHLFLGAEDGMHIIDINTPSLPQYISQYVHTTACDPVVANDKYAYVTIRSGRDCWRQGDVNELHVVNIEDKKFPYEASRLQMTFPQGLGLGGDSLLFVCDNGLKVFDISDPAFPRLTQDFFNVPGYDVIPADGNLIVTAEDGLYQFSYDSSELKPLSVIPVAP